MELKSTVLKYLVGIFHPSISRITGHQDPTQLGKDGLDPLVACHTIIHTPMGNL